MCGAAEIGIALALGRPRKPVYVMGAVVGNESGIDLETIFDNSFVAVVQASYALVLESETPIIDTLVARD